MKLTIVFQTHWFSTSRISRSCFFGHSSQFLSKKKTIFHLSFITEIMNWEKLHFSRCGWPKIRLVWKNRCQIRFQRSKKYQFLICCTPVHCVYAREELLCESQFAVILSACAQIYPLNSGNKWYVCTWMTIIRIMMLFSCS